jgi:hypothetical protein
MNTDEHGFNRSLHELRSPPRMKMLLWSQLIPNASNCGFLSFEELFSEKRTPINREQAKRTKGRRELQNFNAETQRRQRNAER